MSLMKVFEDHSFRGPSKAPRFCSLFYFVLSAKWLCFSLLSPSPGRLGQEIGDLELLVRRQEVGGKTELGLHPPRCPSWHLGFRGASSVIESCGVSAMRCPRTWVPRPWKSVQGPYGEHTGVEHPQCPSQEPTSLPCFAMLLLLPPCDPFRSPECHFI